MLFNSFEYLLFLPCVVLLYWVLPGRLQTFRLILLVLASYLFYMHSFKIYGLLLFGLSAFNYLLALGLDVLAKTCGNRNYKRLLLIAGITFNLGMLCLFKYTNLILDTLNVGLKTLAVLPPAEKLCPLAWRIEGTGLADIPIILPLGISFFVFEFIHYLSDVYKGHKPVKNPLRFALFASFFPSQIAGPIKRYQDFDKQLDKTPKLNFAQVSEALWLISFGLFRKVALGDNLSPIAATGFANWQALGTGEAWLASIAFALQIYFDFAGYTDIGRGSAMLFGYSLPPNFNLPYLATSLKDFWRRWHISLSSWLRDYLYIPLGGSQKGESATLVNLFLTMLLGGLWHGASFTFLLWGAHHGLGLVINRLFEKLMASHQVLRDLCATFAFKAISYLLTMLFVLLGWVLFYARSLSEALGVFKAMFTWQIAGSECLVSHMTVNSAIIPAFAFYGLVLAGRWCFAGVETANSLSGSSWAGVVFKWCHSLRITLQSCSLNLPLPVVRHCLALSLLLLLTLELAPRSLSPFLYFQF
jgi:D-alanyl-lipoteichoic acid acyltransferase DltB (MBOAT superfamily)